MKVTEFRRPKSCSAEFTRMTDPGPSKTRSEEHTSELQSLAYLVCRLLLEKKKNKHRRAQRHYTRITHHCSSHAVATTPHLISPRSTTIHLIALCVVLSCSIRNSLCARHMR